MKLGVLANMDVTLGPNMVCVKISQRLTCHVEAIFIILGKAAVTATD